MTTTYLNGVPVPVEPAIHGAAQHTDITRELFLPANEAHAGAGTPNFIGRHGVVDGGANADEPNIYWTMKVPDDFVSFTSVKAIWECPAASGNARWQMAAFYGASGEAYDTHSDAPAVGTTATGGAKIQNEQESANPLTLSSLAVGDYLGLQLYRTGAHVDDTLDDEFHLFGLLFTYIARQ